jgi:hypothetical protein
MFNLNISEVRQSVTVKTDGAILIDWFFDFSDGSYGALLSSGTLNFHRTLKA